MSEGRSGVTLTIVVLLILAVVWAAVLVPGVVRRRMERGSGDSIGDFHRQLRVLQRTGPPLVDPALRMRASSPQSASAPRPGAVVSNRHGLILVRPDATPMPPADPREQATPIAPRRRQPELAEQRVDPFFHPEATRRRRDVLAGFACAVLGSGLLAVVPALRPMLAVTLAALGATAVYVAMLVRMRNRALERTVKLHYLPEPVAQEPVVAARRFAAR